MVLKLKGSVYKSYWHEISKKDFVCKVLWQILHKNPGSLTYCYTKVFIESSVTGKNLVLTYDKDTKRMDFKIGSQKWFFK